MAHWASWVDSHLWRIGSNPGELFFWRRLEKEGSAQTNGKRSMRQCREETSNRDENKSGPVPAVLITFHHSRRMVA